MTGKFKRRVDWTNALLGIIERLQNIFYFITPKKTNNKRFGFSNSWNVTTNTCPWHHLPSCGKVHFLITVNQHRPWELPMMKHQMNQVRPLSVAQATVAKQSSRFSYFALTSKNIYFVSSPDPRQSRARHRHTLPLDSKTIAQWNVTRSCIKSTGPGFSKPD